MLSEFTLPSWEELLRESLKSELSESLELLEKSPKESQLLESKSEPLLQPSESNWLPRLRSYKSERSRSTRNWSSSRRLSNIKRSLYTRPKSTWRSPSSTSPKSQRRLLSRPRRLPSSSRRRLSRLKHTPRLLLKESLRESRSSEWRPRRWRRLFQSESSED